MKVNKRQKIVLWVALVLFVLMGLFPPWVEDYRGSLYHYGYRCIFITRLRINWSRLHLQWIVLGSITGGLFIAFQEKKTG